MTTRIKLELTARFEAGQITATPALMDWATANETHVMAVIRSLVRHLTGDWGDIERWETRQNERALAHGNERIFSAYNVCGRRVWIITESDPAVTTLMFPSDA